MGPVWQGNAETTAGEPFVRNTHQWNLTNMLQNVVFFFPVQFNTTLCRELAADTVHRPINKPILMKKSVDWIMNFMQSGHFMMGSFYDTWVNKFFFPFDIG